MFMRLLQALHGGGTLVQTQKNVKHSTTNQKFRAIFAHRANKEFNEFLFDIASNHFYYIA